MKAIVYAVRPYTWMKELYLNKLKKKKKKKRKKEKKKKEGEAQNNGHLQ